MIWAVIAPSPCTRPWTPNAFGRSAGSNSTWMMESTWGHIAAPPKPCSRRATISAVGLGAAAQRTDARVKPATPS